MPSAASSSPAQGVTDDRLAQTVLPQSREPFAANTQGPSASDGTSVTGVNAAATAGAVKAMHEGVETFVARQHNTPNVLIVDPPRTGMSKEALDGAIGLKAPVVAYVSCDVATLARDARKFVDAGYTLERLVGFDLFPNTPHVESVATFRR